MVLQRSQWRFRGDGGRRSRRGEELPADHDAQHVDRGLPAHLPVFDDVAPEGPNDHTESESRTGAGAFSAWCASFATTTSTTASHGGNRDNRDRRPWQKTACTTEPVAIATTS